LDGLVGLATELSKVRNNNLHNSKVP
jgi:hypothetical protein